MCCLIAEKLLIDLLNLDDGLFKFLWNVWTHHKMFLNNRRKEEAYYSYTHGLV